jgi:hypothetical protein
MPTWFPAPIAGLKLPTQASLVKKLDLENNWLARELMAKNKQSKTGVNVFFKTLFYAVQERTITVPDKYQQKLAGVLLCYEVWRTFYDILKG